MSNDGQSPNVDFREWLLAAVRTAILANSGGAVATLGFLGASMAQGVVFKLAVIPLPCFALGIVTGASVILGQVYFAWMRDFPADQDARDAATQKAWATRIGSWAEPRTGNILMAAYSLFLLGVGFGLVALVTFGP